MVSRKPRSAERMENSRAKERKRNIEINMAFHRLQESFHSLPWLQRKQKVPKVKMLRLAAKYIEHLTMVLGGEATTQTPFSSPRALKVDDFERVALEEMNQRNSYTKRLYEDEEFVRSEASLYSDSVQGSPSTSHEQPPSTSEMAINTSGPEPQALPEFPSLNFSLSPYSNYGQVPLDGHQSFPHQFHVELPPLSLMKFE